MDSKRVKPIILGRCEVYVGAMNSAAGHGDEVVIIANTGDKVCIGQQAPWLTPGHKLDPDDPRILARFRIVHPDGAAMLISALEYAADEAERRIKETGR